jgi:hypothetical protein
VIHECLLSRRLDECDPHGALRPAIIRPGPSWTLRSQSVAAAAAAERQLGPDEQRGELRRALDLVDALTRSGALPLEGASLHVVLAATHAFDKALMETVIEVRHSRAGTGTQGRAVIQPLRQYRWRGSRAHVP